MCTERRVDSEKAPAGYLHQDYAQSFSEIAVPCKLLHCGGWILERRIPSSDLRDAMGCYPIFACHEWSSLPRDLSVLAERFVSLSLVTDPFCSYSYLELQKCFDIVLLFKQHYVADLHQPLDKSMPRRHRRNIASALDRVRVETCPKPFEMLDEWCTLYGQLVERHSIRGIPTFSRAAFEKQFAVPGLMMFRASEGGTTVGLHLWYVADDVGYGHLGATNVRGYELMASYALYSYAIEQLRDQVRWLDFGAGAGSADDPLSEGLRQFKAGWSTDTRPVFLCGRIFQPDVYESLVSTRHIGPTSYFPAYRDGEFGRVHIANEDPRRP